MKTTMSKERILINLLKTAVREVLKEELASILKTTISETINSTSKILKEEVLQSPSLEKNNSHTGIYNTTPGTPFSPRRTPAANRIFFEDDPVSTNNSNNAELDESAKRIGSGKFSINDLKNIVTEDTVNDPLAGITGDHVEMFIQKTFGK